MAEVLFLNLQVLVPFCEALLMSCICVNGCFASCLKVKGMLLKECKREQGMGGEGSTRKPWGQNVSKKTTPHLSKSIFATKNVNLYIYIFRSWNVVVTY